MILWGPEANNMAIPGASVRFLKLLYIYIYIYIYRSGLVAPPPQPNGHGHPPLWVWCPRPLVVMLPPSPMFPPSPSVVWGVGLEGKSGFVEG